MTERRQKIRGTEIQLDQEVATEGLLAYSIDGHNLRVYDGVTLGGYTILNEAQIADLYALPFRLTSPSVGISGASNSANQASESGWYTTDALVTDQPVAEAGTIFVVRSPDTGLTQTWISKVDGTEYIRRRSGAGVWSTWQRTINASYLTTSAIAYNSARLGGQLPAYYSNIVARLGYTPVNKAGDTITGALTVGGTLTASGNAAVGGTLAVAGQGFFTGNVLTVSGGDPRVALIDTTSGESDFWLYANASSFYVLADRDSSGNYESPYPLQLRNSDGNGFLYGNLILTAADMGPGNGLNADMVDGVHLAGLMQTGWTLTAGNGLTGGGTGAANRTVTLGTPGTLTGSTGNTVSATSHVHDVDAVSVVTSGIAATVYNGSSTTQTNYPIGTTLAISIDGRLARNEATTVRIAPDNDWMWRNYGTGTALTGTWRGAGATSGGEGCVTRTA